MLDQRQPIVAEEHRSLDEHRWRSKTAARDQLLDVLAQLGLVLIGGNLREKFFFFEARLAHDFAQYVVLADILVFPPIALEHALGVTRDYTTLIGDERATHRLD